MGHEYLRLGLGVVYGRCWKPHHLSAISWFDSLPTTMVYTDAGRLGELAAGAGTAQAWQIRRNTLLLAMSDDLWKSLIAAAVTIITVWINRKINRLSSAAASTQELLVENKGYHLKISAMALRRVADLTRHKNDRLMADVAEEYLAEHEKKSGGG